MSATSTPPTPAPASLFPSLGPVGSIATSIVLAAGAAGAGYLAHAGIISGADTVTVGGIIASALAALVMVAYKAISSRMAAKVTAVAAVPGQTVVAPVEVAKSPEHIADPSVITPIEAAKQFGGK